METVMLNIFRIHYIIKDNIELCNFYKLKRREEKKNLNDLWLRYLFFTTETFLTKQPLDSILLLSIHTSTFR